jgi:tetratricopeptide (TPR) repeat protein
MIAAAIGAAGLALAVVPGALAQTAASSSSPEAQAASPSAAPMSDMDKRIAADLLFKRLLIKPDDLDAGFRYAELETELGDYEAAIGALERMLYYNPNLPRVKLQLGVLYFRLHSYEMARNYFDAILTAKDTPPDIQTEVQTYIVAVDKAVATNQFSVYGQFGLAYQTNANAGPNSPNVLAIGQNALLSPQFQKTSDWNAFGLVTAHDFYDFNDQRGDGWESDLIAYYSQQFRVTRLDLGLVELRTGPGSESATMAAPASTPTESATS